jgi:hypothetical protein
MFPGSEDYEPGQSPVRELTLIEQINYWMERAFKAEQAVAERPELVADVEDDDPADFWKREES